MKIRRNDGFSTLYLILIMSSLLFLILMAFEAACASAAASAAENICLSAGRSVLSEYQPALYSRYGIFALRARDDDLSDIASFYIRSSLEGRGVLRMGLENCEISTDLFPGLGTEAIKPQIVEAGKLCAAEALINETELAALLGNIADAEKNSSAGASESLNSLNELKDYSDAEPPCEDPETGEMTEGKPDSPEAKATRKQARELLKRYKEATDPDAAAGPAETGKSLKNYSGQTLPSADLGVARNVSALLSGGVASAGGDRVFIDEYILKACSDHSRKSAEGALELETEYILYGNPGDKENLAAVKREIFGIRFAEDLAAIFADPEKMSEISSAAAAFSFIPPPVAIFILASVEAGIQAKGELGRIMSGETVEIVPAVPGFGSYRDYLRVLLLMQQDDTKLARLMDIMQLEVCRISGKSFSFRDYAYGFELNAEFEDPVRFARFLRIGGSRNETIAQIHSYR